MVLQQHRMIWSQRDRCLLLSYTHAKLLHKKYARQQVAELLANISGKAHARTNRMKTPARKAISPSSPALKHGGGVPVVLASHLCRATWSAKNRVHSACPARWRTDSPAYYFACFLACPACSESSSQGKHVRVGLSFRPCELTSQNTCVFLCMS